MYKESGNTKTCSNNSNCQTNASVLSDITKEDRINQNPPINRPPVSIGIRSWKSLGNSEIHIGRSYIAAFIFLSIILVSAFYFFTFLLSFKPSGVNNHFLGTSLLMTAFGAFLYRKANEQIIINAEVGIVIFTSWKLRGTPTVSNMKTHISPENISAVQLVSFRAHLGRRNESVVNHQVNIWTKSGVYYNLFQTKSMKISRRAGIELSSLFVIQQYFSDFTGSFESDPDFLRFKKHGLLGI